jgi:hypothetical protein
MRNELTSPASGDEIDDAEEIGDDVLAVGLAPVTARSTVAPHGGRWTTCRSSVVAGNTPPPGGRNASSRARAGGEGRFRVRHCSADNSRITLSTYRLPRDRRVHSSAVSSRQVARYSSEIRRRSATKLGSVPISEIS